MAGIDRAVLHQHWVHSHEEDAAAQMVFRPASFNFPRSRGRASFELKSDGGLVEHSIGPADRGQKEQGVWELEKDNVLTFRRNAKAAPHRVMRIVSAGKDRLVIEK